MIYLHICMNILLPEREIDLSQRDERLFNANYRHTPSATAMLVRISRSLGRIQGARVLPAIADQLRASAKAGTVHYSNLIEGNELPFVEAQRAAGKTLEADTRAKVELINYVTALELIDARLSTGTLDMTPDLLRDLHRTTMRGLGRDDDPHFRPSHEGEWRDGTAVVVDRLTGRVVHEGPPASEVARRVEAMFEWLERRAAAGELPFLLAGVAHYGVTDIHPFADGNGRAARLLQTAILMASDVLPGRMFSFERYYAEDRGAYYEALRSVRRNTLNMESWLEYFLRGLVEEYERVAATVDALSALVSPGDGSPLRLTSSEERALASLGASGRLEFNRREYEETAGVGRTTAGREIAELIRHGVLVPVGSGSATRYRFAASATRSPDAPRRGRKPTWSDQRVEEELRAFLADRSAWPPPEAFDAAGRRDLYSAASRRGGIGRWRRMLGL